MYDQPAPQRGEISLHVILTVFLGIGMVLFGLMAIFSYTDSRNIHATLQSRVKVAQGQASADQKTADQIAAKTAAEQPYRNFTADPVDGSFQLQVPKNWSLYDARSDGAQVQVNLIADPDAVIDNTGGNQTLNTHAFHLQLVRRDPADIVKLYDDKVKKGTVKSKPVTVSGISGTWIEGSIDEFKHNGVIIILPVRDKTMTISTENMAYISEFNQIIADAKINP